MAKPTTLPEWNTNANGNKVQASAGIRNDGVAQGQPLAMNSLNFELSTLADWCNFIDSEVRSDTENDARYLLESNNLSDLDNINTARSNLGVYSTFAVNSLFAARPFSKIDWDGGTISTSYTSDRSISGMTVTRVSTGRVDLGKPNSIGALGAIVTGNGLGAGVVITFNNLLSSGVEVHIQNLAGSYVDADFTILWSGEP